MTGTPHEPATRAPKAAPEPSAGARLTTAVLAAWELDEHELLQLASAAKLADRLADLDAIVDRDGVLLPTDPTRVHPALIEARMSRIALARLLAALRLPVDAADAGRPQRRTGARGPYRMGGVA
ncbi:MAG: hypothetical protein JWL79_2930 [Frankiales bacterium]|nr:hypothetical protein [Frankiales bacterium]